MPNENNFNQLSLNLDDVLESFEKIQDSEDLCDNSLSIESRIESQLQQYSNLEEKSKSVQNIIEGQQHKVTQNYLDERNIELLLRIIISGVFIWIIVSQLKKINSIIHSIGTGDLKYDVAVISIYITGVFGQLIALAVIIFNNLFPSDNNKNQTDLIKSILGKTNSTDN